MVAVVVGQEARKCLVLHGKELGEGEESGRGSRCGWLGGGRGKGYT